MKSDRPQFVAAAHAFRTRWGAAVLPALLAAASGFAACGAAQAQGAAASPPQIAPAPLASHRAVYELSLLRGAGPKAPNAASGRISFDFSGNRCDGYVQSFQQETEIQPTEGPTRNLRMRAATFEDGKARNFRFKLDTQNDATGAEQVDGRAVKSGDGALSIDLSRPKTTKLDLDADIAFPTEHLTRVLDAARSGQKVLVVKIFDGSDTGQKIYDTTTVIGAPRTGEVSESAARKPELSAMRRWPVTVSYFEEGKKDSTPTYVMGFDLYENGVSRNLTLDYGDFALKGEIKELELRPTKPCETK